MNAEVQNLREKERSERSEREVSEKLTPASQHFPDAADLLNQLKAKRKKSSASLADVEVLLELLES